MASTESIPVFKNLEAGQKQTVLVYGTSLTFDGAWAEATRQWFEARYPGLVTFINSGGPGESSDWGVSNLKSRVLDHHPDLVFIEFSYNDAHDKFEMPLERGRENLEKMVGAIREQNPDVAIVLQIMNVPWDASNGNQSSTVRPRLERFNDNYRAMAAAEKLPLIDNYPDWKRVLVSAPEKYHLWVPDGSHPSQAGSLAVTWPNVKIFLERCQTASTAK